MAISYVKVPEWCEYCGVYERVPHLADCPLTVLGDFARVLAVCELALAVQAYGEMMANRAFEIARVESMTVTCDALRGSMVAAPDGSVVRVVFAATEGER